MIASLAAAVSAIQAKFTVLKKVEFRGETSLLVDRPQIQSICQLCHDQLGFDVLLDISAVDHFGDEPRFEVVYELYQLSTGTHLRLKIRVSEDELSVPSVVSVWPTADWHERETFDMFGIIFSNHPDLRRILMWEGYPFFPLRKDFPLAGRPSDLPDVAFSHVAPLTGGPFVSVPSSATTQDREPRSREIE